MLRIRKNQRASAVDFIKIISEAKLCLKRAEGEL
jgi:hypothetical protein